MTYEKSNIDWELAARVLNGEADEIDHGLLEQWLNSDAVNRQEWKQIKNAWQKGGDALVMKNIDTSVAWNRVRKFTIDDRKPKHVLNSTRVGVFSAIAASVVLLIGLGWFLFSPGPKEGSSLIVSNSKLEEMVLSDGSAITLNSGSKFVCQQPFGEDERTVTLNGEGYFRVEGDAEWPFVIHAGDISIRVTGTRFNVRAYPNLDITEVAVLEGQVMVLPPGGGSGIALNGGQTALFEKKTKELRVSQSTDPNLLAWITRKISFDQTPLPEVASTLERVYDVNIQISDKILNREKLTARFSDNSLDFVLEVVCVTFNLEMHREGETIFLSRASE